MIVIVISEIPESRSRTSTPFSKFGFIKSAVEAPADPSTDRGGRQSQDKQLPSQTKPHPDFMRFSKSWLRNDAL
jgi:hypothetical protein